VLDVRLSAIRIFVHVLAATVWVGGQFTVAFLLPAIRSLGTDAPRTVARRFALFAWGAYAVLLATGVWNLFAVEVGSASDEYLTTLFVKLGLVAVSGIAAAAHALARSRALIAAGGALSGLAALGALFLGIVLRGG
jgi:putative copper export protein